VAEQAGLGTADLARIDVRGLSIEKVVPLRLRFFPDFLQGLVQEKAWAEFIFSFAADRLKKACKKSGKTQP